MCFNLIWAFGGWNDELDECAAGGANLGQTATAAEARDRLPDAAAWAGWMVERGEYRPGELVVTDSQNRRVLDIYAEAAREHLTSLGLIERREERDEPAEVSELADPLLVAAAG